MEKQKLIQLAEELLTISETIAKEQSQILETSAELESIEADLASHEATLRMQIANEVDSTGKKKYSNSDSREAAFIESAKLDSKLLDFGISIKLLSNRLGKLKVSHTQASDRQRNIRAILAFFSSFKD